MPDVLIIGGGIAGISACAQLAPFAEVVLLEAEPELCYHSSGRSAATYIEDYGNRVTKELNKASLTFLKSESPIHVSTTTPGPSAVRVPAAL